MLNNLNMKTSSVFLFLSLGFLSNLADCDSQIEDLQSHNKSDSDIPYPQLIYMTPKEPAEFTINQRNSFTNELNFGWVLKENQQIDFLFYLFVDEKITELDQISSSYIYFTPDKNQCNLASYEVYDANSNYPVDTQPIFKLTFLNERSKLYQSNSNQIRRRSKMYRIKTRSVTTTSNTLKNNHTLLVGHSTIQLKHSDSKYFACIHFETKKGAEKSPYRNGTLKFVHQGDRNIWSNIITTQTVLPIWSVVILYLVLMAFSSLCSGLNLGNRFSQGLHKSKVNKLIKIYILIKVLCLWICQN